MTKKDLLIYDFIHFGASIFDDICVCGKKQHSQNIIPTFLKDVSDSVLSSEIQNDNALVGELQNSLENSVKKYNRSESFSVMLSGGIDSANILATLKKYNFASISIVSWGGWGEKTTDVTFSKITKQQFYQNSHHAIVTKVSEQKAEEALFAEVLTQIKKPISFSGTIPYVYMAKEMTKLGYPAQVFCGQNADTLFMAYPAPKITFSLFRWLPPILRMSINPLLFISRFKSCGLSRYVRKNKMHALYKNKLNELYSKYIENRKIPFYKKIILMEELFSETRFCQTNQNELMSVMGFDVITPYYDREVILSSFKTPLSVLRKNKYNKWPLYEIAKRNNVSQEIIKKGKKGLSYGYADFITSRQHISIWNDMLNSEILNRYIDVKKAFEKERDNFHLFDRLRSLFYFLNVCCGDK